MSTVRLVNPTLAEDPPPAGRHPAARRPIGMATRLTLVDNGKPRARELLNLIADGIRARTGLASVRVVSKGSASRVLDDAEVAAIAANSDAVIAGLGDCGACSACSLADALRMEDAGIPSTVLISDVFTGHIASFAVSMGMPGYHSATVPHPVSSKDDAQLARFAADVTDQILGQLSMQPTRDSAS
jgi:hypothetical protein